MYAPAVLHWWYFQREDGANVYFHEPLLSLLYGAFIPSPCLDGIYPLGVVKRN